MSTNSVSFRNIWVGLTRGVTGHTLFDTLEVENPPANRNRADGVRSQLIDKIAYQGMRKPLPWVFSSST